MPTDELEATETEANAYVLPWYLRYARRLALLSGATIGIAAGVAVISSSGCSSTCTGICGEVMGSRTDPDAAGFGGAGGFAGVVPNPDAHGFGGAGGLNGTRPAPTDASADSNDDAARPDATIDADDAGGGPRTAPLLPRAWIG